MTVSRDDDIIATTHADCHVRIWETETQRLRCKLRRTDWDPRLTAISFNPKNSNVFVTSLQGKVSKMWDWSDNRVLEQHLPISFDGHIRYHAISEALIFTSQGIIIIWDPQTGNAISTIQDSAKRPIESFTMFLGGTRLLTIASLSARSSSKSGCGGQPWFVEIHSTTGGGCLRSMKLADDVIFAKPLQNITDENFGIALLSVQLQSSRSHAHVALTVSEDTIRAEWDRDRKTNNFFSATANTGLVAWAPTPSHKPSEHVLVVDTLEGPSTIVPETVGKPTGVFCFQDGETVAIVMGGVEGLEGTVELWRKLSIRGVPWWDQNRDALSRTLGEGSGTSASERIPAKRIPRSRYGGTG